MLHLPWILRGRSKTGALLVVTVAAEELPVFDSVIWSIGDFEFRHCDTVFSIRQPCRVLLSMFL
jgi:hypothetical protein